MRSSRHVPSIIVGLMGFLVVACAPPPGGGGSIGPDQRFSGRVNGAHNGAVIRTVCPGPVWIGRTGSPVAGQTLAVTRDPGGDGDTGAYSSVFAQPSDSSGYVVVFDEYDRAQEWPSGVDVPCDGKGTVSFLQCYGIIACTSGSPDVVEVTFVNVAL